ncbi:WD repeat-containing protein 48 [Colletotrichum orbiculare MAFF 240422]|uniref:WD repeat-containing protein 48 n=1 Tax=Colletotrichum orbiculare (strain 104-T / ATCC 96160 / CBS 514.97 / LARS 414 / MAFF 240422) TaxID=1213857 RepID=N4UY97_COLOR|nr:WD repeat-containing protein 48 [Colletotrichum orbiculare MAFF 240422]
MAKRAKQRISYVLELPSGSQGGGHRLGVNGLAIDKDNAILYSGGRDGVICAWDTHLDLRGGSVRNPKPKTTFRSQTTAHMAWINDIVLADNNSAVVTASNDLTVKVWRPHSEARENASKIGEHKDYVKCVATPPDGSANWVASGGFDRKIYLWDLNGGGQTLEIDTKGDEVAEKGSIYALSVGHNIMANGGPESVVRLWDPRSGKRVTKFVGHTDNVRGILLNEAGDKVLTASSDHTIKLWSVTAGRCIYTFTMHEDSVWSLFSDDPELRTFYSSDRSGFVVKTDVPGNFEDLDDGLSVAVAHESHSISKVVAAGDYIWTATNTSSINRWSNVDTGPDLQLPEAFRRQRAASTASRPRQTSSPPPADSTKKDISARSILRISNTATFPVQTTTSSDASPETGANVPHSTEPIRQNPEETIEGQFGLVKHKLLNDRRRVLTLDTAGDVLLWDLIKCVPTQSFGKRHLEDVEDEINTNEVAAPWCSIDISSGSLTVVLEPYNCFDAEMYADELELPNHTDFREDQRVNLGKWVLRYLFAGLIEEEIRRDEAYRQTLNESVERRLAASRANPPSSISIPAGSAVWDENTGTPRANGTQYPMTPGMAINLATPGVGKLQDVPEGAATPASPLDNRSSQAGRPSADKEDYFTSAIGPIEGAAKSTAAPATPATEQPPASDAKSTADASKDKGKDKDKDKDGSNGKSPSTPFGKTFGKKFGMSFGSKKIGRSASTTAPEKPAVVDEKADESEEASSTHEKEVDDSFFGAIQKIRNDYDKSLTENPDKLIETKITPSLPNDTPLLRLPLGTKVVLQEETTGGSANIYQGTVDTVGQGADMIEKRGPMWLGEVLLQNQIPVKEPVKVSFILHPWQNSLPDIATTDGNNRLNANRMLRVKKILAYVAERIEPASENPESDALLPHEYLELYCNDQLLPITMTLATLRTHVWKGGNDVLLYYKANGRKEIANPPPQPPAAPDGDLPPEASAKDSNTPPAA